MITAAILVCLMPVPHDGDTVRCGKATSVRLYGVNSVDHTPADTVARDALVPLVAGGLLCEPKGASYSRVVAICFNSQGVDVGKALITRHLAPEWCSYSRNYYGTCVPTP